MNPKNPVFCRFPCLPNQPRISGNIAILQIPLELLSPDICNNGKLKFFGTDSNQTTDFPVQLVQRDNRHLRVPWCWISCGYNFLWNLSLETYTHLHTHTHTHTLTHLPRYSTLLVFEICFETCGEDMKNVFVLSILCETCICGVYLEDMKRVFVVSI